jgi:NAD(P)-dependent dehydrogenase (short-subunit alcohol dehydrogenase family)
MPPSIRQGASMAASINSSPGPRERDLRGQIVLVIGGSSSIGLETARLARARGPDRLQRAGLELGASIAAFDATDFGRLGRFFDALSAPIDHLLVTAPGCTPPAGPGLDAARRAVDAHLLLPLQVARHAASKIRPPGTLLFTTGLFAAGPPAAGPALTAALAVALPAMTKSLALEMAPVRVNLLATGWPGRLARPADVAVLAVYLMTSTTVTGTIGEVE